ncbi:hypothetical protein V2L00_12475 [Pseudomonas alliivorans]|nr:hypothetical protein [Pseudomonas alliivorans]
MGMFLDGFQARKLAPDQRKTLCLERYGKAQETLMVSESSALIAVLNSTAITHVEITPSACP